MKRISLFLAVFMGLAVAAMAGLWSSNSASAQAPEGLKCYRTKNVKSEFQPNNHQLVYISDQFEEKNLIVKNPIAFCAMAEKAGFGGGTAGDEPITDLLCYAIKDAPGQTRFTAAEIETEDQFDSHDLLITKPFALCETATKQVVTAPGSGGDDQILENFSFKCYKTRRLENGNNRWEKIELDIFDQFYPDAKEVRLGRPTVFCTQVVEKKDKAKNNHIENARLLEGPEDEHHASTISATNDRSDPPASCAEHGYGHSVWYTYTPQNPDDEFVKIDTVGSTYDTIVAVYRDNGDGDLEEVACNDDFDYPSSGESLVEPKLEYGQKYFILVGAWAADQGGKLKLHLEVTGSCASCSFPDPEPDAVAAGQATPERPNPVVLASAVKSEPVGGTAGELPINLDCYSISQRAPEDAVIQAYTQFNAHQFEIGRGNMYCTPANKCIFLSGKQTAGDLEIRYCSDN